MSELSDYFKLCIIILILIISIILVTYYNGRQIIINNWNNYRCNPLIIPIAGLFGKPTDENMKKCFYTFFKSYFAFLIVPIQYIIKIIEKIFAGLFEDLNVFRKLLKPIRLFILNSTQKFYSRLNQFNTMIVYSFSKMRDTMKKMSSVFRLTLYTLEVMEFTMKSIWDGPIGEVSRDWAYAYKPIKTFFCIHPDSKIVDKLGNYISINKLPLGSALYNNNKLIGKASFWADNIKLYYYKGVWCSGDHLVLEKGRWSKVNELSEQFKIYSGLLICPSTEKNIFHTNPFDIWRDFEEYDTQSYRSIELYNHLLHLNGNRRLFHFNMNQKIYSTIGFHQDSILYDKKVDSYQIGDYLDDSIIIGKYIQWNTDDFYYKHHQYPIIVGARQLCSEDNGLWTLCSDNTSFTQESIPLHNNLFVSFLIEKQYIEYKNIKFSNIFDSQPKEMLDIQEKLIIDLINHQTVEELSIT